MLLASARSTSSRWRSCVCVTELAVERGAVSIVLTRWELSGTGLASRYGKIVAMAAFRYTILFESFECLPF